MREYLTNQRKKNLKSGGITDRNITPPITGNPRHKAWTMVRAPWERGPLILNPIYTLCSGYLLRISLWVLLMVHKCWYGTHSTFIGPNKICWLSCGIILRTSHIRKASANMLPLVSSLDKSYTSEGKYGSAPAQSFRKFHTHGVQPDCSQGIT